MPVKKPKIADLSNEDIALHGLSYVQKKEAIKTLEGQCKEERVLLEDYAKRMGKPVGSSGSTVAVVEHADVAVHLKETARTSAVLLPEALDILKKEGYKECIEKVEIVREDIVEKLHRAGKISDELLSQIYGFKTSHAFSVEVKKRFVDE